MVREAAPVDISTVPGLAELIDEMDKTHQPWAIQDGDETVALLVPVKRRRQPGARPWRVDTSSLPPPRYHTLDELIQDLERPPASPFTKEEIREAVDRDRAQAWRAKHP